MGSDSSGGPGEAQAQMPVVILQEVIADLQCQPGARPCCPQTLGLSEGAPHLHFCNISLPLPPCHFILFTPGSSTKQCFLILEALSA